MIASIWGAILHPIAEGSLFSLLRRLFPLRRADVMDAPLTDEERRVFSRWEGWANVPLLVFALLLGFAWYFALKEAAGLFQHGAPGTRFLVRPTIFWALPAIFLGIISSAVPVKWLYRSLLRDRYRRYERSCNERVGFDGKRANALLAALVVVGSSVGFVAGATSFTRFDETGVEIGRPLSFRSEFHPYQSVKSIERRATIRAPSGNTVRSPHYVVVFDDGRSWSTHEGLRDPEPELDDPIAQLVAQKSGRPIVERP